MIPEDKLKEQKAADEAFTEFIGKFKEKLELMLNPEGSAKDVGFACFIFSKDPEKDSATLVTNAAEDAIAEAVMPFLKVAMDKARMAMRKDLRRVVTN